MSVFYAIEYDFKTCDLTGKKMPILARNNKEALSNAFNAAKRRSRFAERLEHTILPYGYQGKVFWVVRKD